MHKKMVERQLYMMPVTVRQLLISSQVAEGVVSEFKVGIAPMREWIIIVVGGWRAKGKNSPLEHVVPDGKEKIIS